MTRRIQGGTKESYCVAFKKKPKPTPIQNPPSAAILTFPSPSASTNPATVFPTLTRSGPKSEIENITRDGKCNGSYERPKHDLEGSHASLCRSRPSLKDRTFRSVSVSSLKRLATSWDNVAAHSDSHFALSHGKRS